MKEYRCFKSCFFLANLFSVIKADILTIISSVLHVSCYVSKRMV